MPSSPTERPRPAAAARAHARERVVERVGRLVEVARLEPPLEPGRVDLDAEDGRVEHGRGERLRAAHAAEAGRQHRPPGEVAGAEVLLGRGGERLVRALQDPLGADVDPAAGRHLAEHRQPERLEAAELVPRRPARHEHRVRDQHARRARVRPEDADGLAALDEQRLVVAEVEQRADERAQALVVPRRLARAAVDDELLRPLGHLAVEVVEQHAERRLGLPGARVQLRAARRADRATGRRRATRRARRATPPPSLRLLLLAALAQPVAPVPAAVDRRRRRTRSRRRSRP